MRFPQTAQRLTPSRVTDAYGDEVDGPLSPAGDPFPAWLQVRDITEAETGATTQLLSLYAAPGTVLEAVDAVEVAGVRYRVSGGAVAPVGPRGRPRYAAWHLTRIERGE